MCSICNGWELWCYESFWYPSLAVCLSGNLLVSISVVAVRWARLVIGWVTICGHWAMAGILEVGSGGQCPLGG